MAPPQWRINSEKKKKKKKKKKKLDENRRIDVKFERDIRDEVGCLVGFWSIEES